MVGKLHAGFWLRRGACRGQGHQVLMPSILPFTSPTHIFFARPAHHLNPSQHPTNPTQNRSHH